MNKVIRKSLTATLLSVFVFSLVFPGGHAVSSVPAIPVAHASGCTAGAIATAIANQVNDIIPSVGETITYTLNGTISNISDPTTVTVNDVLGAGLTFVSSTASVGTYSNSTGVWDLGTVNSSTSVPVSLQISATVNAGTEGQIIDSEPTIDYSQSVGTSCAQSAAINAISMTVEGTPIPPSADLSVTKNVDVTTTTPGNTVHYTVVVRDKGPATSTGATAKDILPAGLIFQTSTASVGSYATSTGIWTIGDLAPSSTATLVYAATVDPSITATTTIVNSVLVSENASTTDPVVGNNTASVGFLVVPNATITPTSTPSADLSITKTANVTSTVPGGVIDYTISVANLSSSTTSTDVVATDTLPTGLTFENDTASASTSYASSTGTWTIGDLSPNSTATLQIAALVNATGTAGTTITNIATAIESASTTDPNPSNNSSSVSVFVRTTPTSTPVADIGIVKSVDNTNPAVGNTVNYTLTATAYGPATSTDVVATDTLPSGLTFVSATSSEGFYASSTGTWTIGDMSARSTATLKIVATVNSGTENDVITNTGLIGESASTTDNDLTNNSSSVSVTVQGGGGCTGSCGATDADIAISKTADVTSTIPGNTVNYTLTATAYGPATSTDVVATDTLPSGLTFVSATSSEGFYASSTGTWTIGDMSARSTATLKIVALVNATGTAGTTITNTATVNESSTETDTNLGNNSSSVSILVGSPVPSTDADLAITKTVDSTSPAAGATVNFIVTVTDNGPATSTFVHVQDQLPAGLAFVSASTSQGLYDLTTGDWDIETLGPNATATLTMAAEVASNATGGTTITNTAKVYSTLASLVDPDTSNNTASVTLTVPSSGCTSNCGGGGGGGGGGSVYADMSITKTVDNSSPATGATIHYTLTAKDTGQNPTFGVVADDVLPAGITFVSATSSEGSYASSTGVWTIGALNAGQAATLTITATVTAAGGTSIVNTATVSETPTIMDPFSGDNTASATIKVAGAGGQVLGASTSTVATSTGQVLGASCGLYLTSYIHPHRQSLNNSIEVKKLQTFLNTNLGLNIPVTGYYGALTIAAVDQFQVKYHNEVLAPWVPLGLPTPLTPTNYVYQSTQRWINLIVCPSLNLPLPALKVDNGE